ncbi:hypothetical protein SDC9_189161 [bioreactor metagenome]|uniref:Uncharacterized protein n=1 Tax=bioreactor metagenome TaxID=1076179 RepID=A0A645HRP5_9ZZZZ
MEGHRGHAPLVVLPGTVNVEVAEADDLGAGIGQAAAHHLVEQELGVAVDVERPLVLALLLEHVAGAVSRGRRGVEELDVLVLTPVEQDQRVAIVVLHHVATVGLHGVGAGAFVQDGFDLAVVMTGLDALDEIVLVEVVGDFAVDQVLELVGLGQVIDCNDIGDAALVQRLDNIGADETGSTGDDVVHGVLLTGRRAVPGG